MICDLRGVLLEPKVPTLVLVPDSESDIIRILRSGHHGYLRPNAGRQQLAKAIETLLRNDHWVERTLLSRAFVKGGALKLTRREEDVYGLLVQGLSNKAIADRLGVAEKTVKVYVSSLLEKYTAKSRKDLIVSAKDLRPKT